MQYIDDSATTGYFLDEQEYEWGYEGKCSEARGKIQKDSSLVDPRIWQPCAMYWRQKIQEQEARPFENWITTVIGDTIPPADMCTRILQAGGAVVLSRSECERAPKNGVRNIDFIALY